MTFDAHAFQGFVKIGLRLKHDRFAGLGLANHRPGRIGETGELLVVDHRKNDVGFRSYPRCFVRPCTSASTGDRRDAQREQTECNTGERRPPDTTGNAPKKMGLRRMERMSIPGFLAVSTLPAHRTNCSPGSVPVKPRHRAEGRFPVTVPWVPAADFNTAVPSFHPEGNRTSGNASFMCPDEETVTRLAERFRSARTEVEKVIVGQSRLLERILIALLAGGHVLIEGVPGLAKTRTVRTFAEVLGGSWQRVQFTPDLVPSDLVGTRVWLPGEGRFSLEIGPVSTNFLLADEINRAPAKVQSALLEAMEEHQVTIGRETVRLPDPFLVLATQNPLESEGTYPLPEAQTDRFMFRVVVTYPSAAEELEVVRRALVGTDQPQRALTIADVVDARVARRGVHVPKDVADAAVRLTALTRPTSDDALVLAGAGPRGSLALVAAAQARALLHGRNTAVLGDVLDLAVDVLSHRVQLSHRAVLDGLDQHAVTAAIVETSGLLG